VVRLAYKDRGKAHVRRRAALLRACAVAALAVQPALAAPNHPNSNEFANNALADHGPPVQAQGQAQATSGPGRSGDNGNAASPTVADAGGNSPAVTVNSGTFDVAVTPPVVAEPGKSGEGNGTKPNLPSQSAALPPPAR
jgi:hypothetical protein